MNAADGAKTPIEVSEIRKGDIVRVEYRDRDVLLAGVTATEYKAGHDYDAGKVGDLPVRRPCSHFLLDRPTPPVELPSTGLTWGTLVADRVQYEGLFQREGDVILHIGTGHRREPRIPIEAVTAWSPLVVVPLAALDELRKTSRNMPEFTPSRAFLAAVDAATGAQA